jgi:hypothetical protein
MAALFVPWAIRNAVQLDAFIPGTNGIGQVLIQAHHPAAGGEPNYWLAALPWDEHRDVPLPEREIQANRYGLREAIEYALTHPGQELALAPHRFAAFFRDDRGALVWNASLTGEGEQALSRARANALGVIADVYYYGVIAIALFTLPLWISRSRGAHWLLWGTFLAYSFLWAFVFVGESRYHVTLLPVFSIVAGIGLVTLLERLRGRRLEASSDTL